MEEVGDNTQEPQAVGEYDKLIFGAKLREDVLLELLDLRESAWSSTTGELGQNDQRQRQLHRRSHQFGRTPRTLGGDECTRDVANRIRIHVRGNSAPK